MPKMIMEVFSDCPSLLFLQEGKRSTRIFQVPVLSSRAPCLVALWRIFESVHGPPLDTPDSYRIRQRAIDVGGGMVNTKPTSDPPDWETNSCHHRNTWTRPGESPPDSSPLRPLLLRLVEARQHPGLKRPPELASRSPSPRRDLHELGHEGVSSENDPARHSTNAYISYL